MELVDQLMNKVQLAENAADELARNEEATEKRRAAYDRLGTLFDQMAADGQLDKKEVEALMKEFRALGLDTATLDEVYKQLKNSDGTARVDVTTDLRNKISDQLMESRHRAGDPGDVYKSQVIMSEFQQSFDLAGRVMKAENEIYMTAIRHLVA